MSIIKERWKHVVGYEGYYNVSNLGQVKTLRRKYIGKDGRKRVVKERILSSPSIGNKYVKVTLHKDGVNKTYRVHQLVATAFIPNPQGKPHINHRDGIKYNNIVDNLHWCTPGENQAHAIEMGLLDLKGERSHYAKLKEADVIEICTLLDLGVSCRELSEIFKLHPETIRNIKVGNTWNHLTNRKFCFTDFVLQPGAIDGAA